MYVCVYVSMYVCMYVGMYVRGCCGHRALCVGFACWALWASCCVGVVWVVQLFPVYCVFAPLVSFGCRAVVAQLSSGNNVVIKNVTLHCFTTCCANNGTYKMKRSVETSANRNVQNVEVCTTRLAVTARLAISTRLAMTARLARTTRLAITNRLAIPTGWLVELVDLFPTPPQTTPENPNTPCYSQAR